MCGQMPLIVELLVLDSMVRKVEVILMAKKAHSVDELSMVLLFMEVANLSGLRAFKWIEALGVKT